MPKRLNHPLSAYLIGAFFMGLILIVLAGVIHHLAMSHHGPGLMRSVADNYNDRNKSDILDQAQRLAELEQHRHFHNIAEEYPKLPEPFRPTCYLCHSDFPHSKNKRVRGLMNIHTQFLVCQTCHVKNQNGQKVVHKWYHPQEPNPQGPFYGTGYDNDSGYLSSGKNLLAKIAPHVYHNGDPVPLVELQNSARAKDYINVRDKLNPEQREGVKNKFHESIRPKGYDCRSCHTDKSLLNLRALEFEERRIANLKNLVVVGMIERYEEFYLPELFPEQELKEVGSKKVFSAN